MARMLYTISGTGAVVLWGLLALLSVRTQSFGAFQLLTVCFSWAFLIMLLSRWLRKQPILKPPRMPIKSWLTHFTGLFGFHLCYFFAIRFAPAIEVSLIAYLWPLLLGVFVAQPGARISACVAGLIGFCGSAYLISNDNGMSIRGEYIVGYGLALACAFIWSGYSWMLTRLNGGSDDIGWAALLVAIAAYLAHLILEPNVWDFTLSEWLFAMLLGLGPVGGAFFMWDAGMKRGNRSLLAALSFTTPVISTLALFFAGLTALNHAVVVALVLIISAALLSQRRPPANY